MPEGGVGVLRRSPPVVPLDRALAREQLVSRLAERFSRRVVTLVAHAGSGKTTALALAMEANRIDPWGRDVWLALDRRDDEPDRLLAAIADALGVAAAGGRATTDAIVDAIWSEAPDDIALILDDVHVLQSGETLTALADLIRELPANAHFVLASRARVQVPLARLRAQFEVIELDADDLAFDDDELGALIELRGARPGAAFSSPSPTELPRVPALADLTLRFGAGAGAEFLWDEVLASFESAELEVLRRLALIDVADDALAQEITRSAGATPALEELALIDRDDAGRFVMHDLLRTALLAPLSTDERRRLAAAAADDAEGAGDRSLAVALHVDAGNHERAGEVARAFIMTATLRRTLEQIKRVSQSIDRIEPDGPLAGFLRAELWSGQHDAGDDSVSQAVEFGLVADLARSVGDEAVEAAASYRCHQQSLLELLPIATARIDRLAELAPRLPYAAQVLRFARASQHLRSGDSERAWAEIVELDDVADPQSEQVFRAGLMCLLGRFDEVVDEFGARDAGTLAPGVDEYVVYALYLSGRLRPEDAAPMFESMSAGFVRAQLAQTSVVLYTTGALIALHVGDHELAGDRLAAARDVVRSGCAPSFAVNAETAAAMHALCRSGERAAQEVLDASLAEVELGGWPNAAHLTILPLLYVLYPDRRERLDSCVFGRPTTVARSAGRALVALREHDDTDPAIELPWDEANLLRVQVPPPMLAELAAVATVGGVRAAGELLESIPHVERWLRRCARQRGPSGDAATTVLAGRPRVPDLPLHVSTLGPLIVERDGVVVDHPDLTRRSRVQQLLAVLAERRSISRADAAELLWPDLEAKSASNNLRVTLAYLNRALEPERDPEEPPIYVTQQGDHLGLHPDVTTDLDALRAAVRSGQSHARRRAPRSAIEAYRSAAELLRGEFLAEHDASWLDGPRRQVRFDAIHTLVRLGELTLASGEPEDAALWALRARELGERHDRVERLLAACQLATGDRTGAVRTLRTLVAELRADGVEPEVETFRMLDRVTT